ncbi:MAG: hypothetical protein A2231_04840 [Candidatus Firestonebacteria bacterium RIFOXYA2_FULL_40_8]|nr:MAG: hypothetical protein A2231_04840 [Candidatus Firestonebacteria bacterium RIFOXYA2_FULL_40_8]
MKVISGISVIAFAVIAVTNIFLPKYGYNLPTQGPIFTILVVFGAWYVIENYSFLKPTIEDVAKTTLELIQDGVVITDKEGKIISANKVAAKLLGYSNQDLPQKKLIDYIDKGAAEYAFWKRKEAGIISAIKQSSVKLNGKSGQISVNFSVSVLKDRSGFFEGYVAVLHDIRKIIMMQEQELKNNKEIQEAYLLLKMEEMDLRNIQEKMIKEELEMITLKQNINNELLKSKKGTRYTEKRSLA